MILLGLDGRPGPSGLKGDRGASLPTGFLIVRHSQDQTIPSCPADSVKLWEGYSLLYLEGNERAHNQDLGKSSEGKCSACLVGQVTWIYQRVIKVHSFCMKLGFFKTKMHTSDFDFFMEL